MARYLVLCDDGSVFWTKAAPKRGLRAIVYNVDTMMEKSPDTNGEWVPVPECNSYGRPIGVGGDDSD